MKFIIGVDCEGPACVVGSPGGSLNDSRNLEFAKLQATREADAAARGLFDAGAEQVIVWDNHNGSLNLHYDLLDERCDIALGVGGGGRWPGMDEKFSGVCFVGYHAKDNTYDAPICHSFSSAAYQYMKVNGTEVGELAIDAACAGELGVPPIFVSSDDKAIAEAKGFFPWIETVQTKVGLGWSMALSKHPKRSCKDIYEGSKRAVARLKEMKPFTFDSPLEFEIRHKRLEAAQSQARSKSGWESIDPYTNRKRLEKITDHF